jgi:hypothetical protein
MNLARQEWRGKAYVGQAFISDPDPCRMALSGGRTHRKGGGYGLGRPGAFLPKYAHAVMDFSSLIRVATRNCPRQTF